MTTHYGNIVEYTVRRKGVNIADLARVLKINRRSLYNWFGDENLKIGYIFKIGMAIRHDFSKEFPSLFTEDQFQELKYAPLTGKFQRKEQETDAGCVWKERYITLLENYNSFLSAHPELKPQKCE